MKKPKDKRTKEYKDWKKNNSKKPDNTIDNSDKLAKSTTDKDCGCYKKKNSHKDLKESEYIILDDFFKKNNSVVRKEDQKKLLIINNRVFDEKKQGTSCAPCVKKMIDRLRKLYNEY